MIGLTALEAIFPYKKECHISEPAGVLLGPTNGCVGNWSVCRTISIIKYLLASERPQTTGVGATDHRS